jgi:hypothetical protein
MSDEQSQRAGSCDRSRRVPRHARTPSNELESFPGDGSSSLSLFQREKEDDHFTCVPFGFQATSTGVASANNHRKEELESAYGARDELVANSVSCHRVSVELNHGGMATISQPATQTLARWAPRFASDGP